ncbi:hypothetical protein LTR37_006649 [Vermiconidia calcicola]|uniref:Uncharacterized protein n=1 Tax=Vermiconidia calcicola TaxID=1690605 RepID=A0ACC3NFW3_9PEZI|nr:hypothetical protein LTR37_006649 [Vermiconidia calcicola]
MAETQESSLKHVYFFLEEQAAVSPSDGFAGAGEASRYGTVTHAGLEEMQKADSAVTIEQVAASPSGDLPGAEYASTYGTSIPSGKPEMNPLAPAFWMRKKESASSVPALNAASSLVEIRKVEGKGCGLFAVASIPRGTMIISEAPLMKILNAGIHLTWGPYCRLSNQDKAAYDAMYGYQPPSIDFDSIARTSLVDPFDDTMDGGDVDKLVAEQIRVMSTFAINSFNLQPHHLGIYASISRLNHSCVPNVHSFINGPLGVNTIYATKDILPNEELTITYLGGRASYLPRSKRIPELHRKFGFICQCSACTDQTGASDGRRELLDYLAWGLNEYNDHSTATDACIPASHAAALSQAEDLIITLKQEGLDTIELTKAYRIASYAALKIKNYEYALQLAREESEVEKYCLGTDLRDLRRLGIATESWFKRIYETIEVWEGKEVAREYQELSKKEKQKKKARRYKKAKRVAAAASCAE